MALLPRDSITKTVNFTKKFKVILSSKIEWSKFTLFLLLRHSTLMAQKRCRLRKTAYFVFQAFFKLTRVFQTSKVTIVMKVSPYSAHKIASKCTSCYVAFCRMEGRLKSKFQHDNDPKHFAAGWFIHNKFLSGLLNLRT